MVDRAGEPPREIPLPVHAAEPQWSPDGTRVLFVGYDAGVGSVSVVNPDGTGLTTIATMPEIPSGPQWSPDGKRIAVQLSIGVKAVKRSVVIMNADGSNRRTLVESIDGAQPWDVFW